MKTYSIGRDINCDIVINDSTDVVSRRHALLNITPSGKMTIVDQSSNGTYVNGIRIAQNVPVPVTRKDIVSLAHVAKLDWSQVPKSNQWTKYTIGSFIIIILVLGLVFGMKYLKMDSNSSGAKSIIIENDSTVLKQQEAARLDSIKNVMRQDSLKKVSKKVRQDSTKKTPRNGVQTKKKTKEAEKEEKKRVLIKINLLIQEREL